MNVPTFRPLGFGEILDGAFTLYRRNFVTFLVTALIPVLVVIAAFAVFGAGLFVAMASGDPAALMGAAGSFLLLMILSGLAYGVMWAALNREAAQAYLGRPTSVGDGMRAGLRKLLPVIGASIVMFLAVVVMYFAVAVVVVLLAGVGAATGSGAVAVALTVVAGAAGFAAILIAIAMFFAVLPAIVVEDKGPLEAIGRSFDLARGALGRVVGLMLVSILICYLPVIAVMLLTGGFASVADPSAVPSASQVMTQQFLSWGVGVLTTPFLVAVIVLLYFDRRVRTEALDVQMAAQRLAVAGT